MGEFFTPFDLFVFFVSLIGAMAVGLIAGRKEETSEDYFLAGRSIPWWGVAGSIFGTNVSANHLVGMMGVGFSVGFAQSHFELGAVFGLLALCYLFLPVYRRLKIFTLSEYLGRRYGDSSRLLYAMIMVVIMVGVQMVPGLYIGARTICFMLGGDAVQQHRLPAERLVGDDDDRPADAAADQAAADQAADGNADDVAAGGGRIETRVNMTYYVACVIGLALVAAGYTIVGGLKAVVWTDVIQSFLLLAAGIGVALLTFDKIGGWSELMTRDMQGAGKMHLYLPSHHPQLPWTGVFTGLLAMHCFYWGTNQFIVQRALGARSDRDAQLGIVAAGFLKLLIPFFAIGTGVAAYYLFAEHRPGQAVDPDTAFPILVQMVVPVGYGIVGLISAGLIGAILSSIDSMMNSAATIVTVDVYQRYVKPEATERDLLRIARGTIAVFVTLAAVMAILVLDPNSKKNFFLQIADYQNYLTPGILVAFVLGIVWKRGTAAAGVVTICAGVVFSWAAVQFYDAQFGMHPAVYRVATDQQELERVAVSALPEEVQSMTNLQRQTWFRQQADGMSEVTRVLGPSLNFFHRVVVVILLSALVYVAVSLCGRFDEEKGRLTWTDLGGHAAGDLQRLLAKLIAAVVLFSILGFGVYQQVVEPFIAGLIAAVVTLVLCLTGIRNSASDRQSGIGAWLTNDRAWGAVLCALAVFLHFYFY